MALVEGLDPGHGDAASLRIQADQLSRQLCQGRQVALRLGQGPVFGLAPFPAVVGRDGGVQVRLRDPTVSRRHALLRRREADILVEDAGSRGGTRLQGLLISAPLPLRGTGELTFGEQERCEFQLHGKTLLGLRALTGIDRNSRWLIGEGPLPLTEIDARLTDLTIGFGERGPHLLIAAGAAVSVGGQRRTGRWDLAHGDEIDAGSVEGRLLVL